MVKCLNILYNLLTNPVVRFDYFNKLGMYNNMIDETFLKRKYKLVFGRELNLNDAKTFTEKLQWLKLFDRNDDYTMMVDKYSVREYVEKKIGKEYLIPLIGVWDTPDEIKFDKLPMQFVLKCNHNSGLGMVICRDKDKLNIENVKRGLGKGIKQDYYLFGREWPYKNVHRRIIAEKYMSNEGKEIDDYKIYNFNGVPKAILVCRDRFKKTGMTEDFFTPEWKTIDMKWPNYPISSERIARPEELDVMLELAKKLSKDIPFVRTDFYIINHKIYFGEMTFHPTSGFEKIVPEKWDEIWGSWLELPKKAANKYE